MRCGKCGSGWLEEGPDGVHCVNCGSIAYRSKPLPYSESGLANKQGAPGIEYPSVPTPRPAGPPEFVCLYNGEPVMAPRLTVRG